MRASDEEASCHTRPARQQQEEETYISRCMEHITRYEKDKFPDQDQRAAICYSTWDRWQKCGHPRESRKVGFVPNPFILHEARRGR